MCASHTLLATSSIYQKGRYNLYPPFCQPSIPLTHPLDVLFRVLTFSQNSNNIFNNEVPFFIIFIPNGSYLLTLKKLDITHFEKVNDLNITKIFVQKSL